MEQEKGLAGLFLAIILLQGALAKDKTVSEFPIKVEDLEDGSVLLTCNLPDAKWQDNGTSYLDKDNTWNLGSSIKDPRGIHHCKGLQGSFYIQVHYRMCHKCIELNTATISGFVFAEIISIFFLGVGVYLIAGQDGVHQSRASDKQILLSNDQLYQPLKEREDDQYSQIQAKQPRKK